MKNIRIRAISNPCLVVKKKLSKTIFSTVVSPQDQKMIQLNKTAMLKFSFKINQIFAKPHPKHHTHLVPYLTLPFLPDNL